MAQSQVRVTRPASLLSFFRDDFRMETWLLAGASLQALAFLVAGRYAAYLTALALVYQLGVGLLKDTGLLKSDAASGTRWGKWGTKIPTRSGKIASKPGQEEVVVFLLGTRSSHPRGRFAPGYAEIGAYFGDMWRDCLKNRKTNGFLGKTSTLIATEQDCNNTMCWISYWKDLDSLRAFANGPVHSKGMKWYLSTALKKFPNVGIMHETYQVPRGHWETIAYNQKPFGLATTEHFVPNDKSPEDKEQVDILFKADGEDVKTMGDRMG